MAVKSLQKSVKASEVWHKSTGYRSELKERTPSGSEIDSRFT